MGFEADSWFDPRGVGRHRDLVAQIFFSFDRATLDLNTDDVALRRLVDYFTPILERQYLHFLLVGRADYRGNREYNQRLGIARAHAVKRFLDRAFRHTPNYFSSVDSLGNTVAYQHVGDPGSAPSDQLALDRGVDVICRYTHSYRADELLVAPDVSQSTRFLFWTIVGVGAGVGGVAGQGLTINIENPRNGERRRFMYVGIGGGVGVGANRPSQPEERTVPQWMRVDDFEGAGLVHSISIGVSGGALLEFSGPMDRRIVPVPVRLTFTGWDLNIGIEGDLAGDWEGRERSWHPPETPPRGRY